ncbi:MAG TPA: hypothetical protein VG318_04570 [Actinomycetota bacterium]|nr:hypothetical protein [Actinomycetota bacterium]
MAGVGRAVGGLAGKAVLLAAGAIIGAIGWLAVALLYAWVFEVSIPWLYVPSGVMVVCAAVFARERQLWPFAGGIVLGAVFPVVAFLQLVKDA